MFNRNLREDRHPRHAAEVRENIVPGTSFLLSVSASFWLKEVSVIHHDSMDLHSARSTLFLHEDILARTLSYEQQLQSWRIAELAAGRSDPGRPSYQIVGYSISFHGFFSWDAYFRYSVHASYHAASDLDSFLRKERNSNCTYDSIDCPGIGTSQWEFPVIKTLLSIPFSLLYNLPRLAGLVPLSTYQQRLITMGSDIIRLWWWEPSPAIIIKPKKIRSGPKRPTKKPRTEQRQPKSIHLISTTFSVTTPTTTYGTSSGTPNHARRTELPLGQISFGTVPSVLLDRDGLLLTSAEKGSAKLTHAGKGSVTRSFVASASEDSAEGTEDLNKIYDTDGKSEMDSLPFDVISWYEEVVDCGPGSEPLLPLAPAPFERGVIGGRSVNDTLMIKGLIHPLVYVHFLDLSSFMMYSANWRSDCPDKWPALSNQLQPPYFASE